MLYAFLNRRHKASVNAVFPEPTGLTTYRLSVSPQSNNANLDLPTDAHGKPALGEVAVGVIGHVAFTVLPWVANESVMRRTTAL
jgi:hypothetical protein